MAIIYIRAQNAWDCGEGIYELTLPSVEVSPEQRAMLLELFPNTIDRAFELMDREILLRSMVPAEMMTQKMVEKAKDVPPPPYKKGKTFGAPKVGVHPAPSKPNYLICNGCGNTIMDEGLDHDSDCPIRYPRDERQ